MSVTCLYSVMIVRRIELVLSMSLKSRLSAALQRKAGRPSRFPLVFLYVYSYFVCVDVQFKSAHV